MKIDKLKIGFLIIELMLLLVLAFVFNSDIMFENFKFNKQEEIWNNYYFHWCSIFILFSEKIINIYKMNDEKKDMLSIHFLTLFILLVPIVFDRVLIFIILINIFTIWKFRYKLKIVLIILVLTTIAAFSSYLYNKISNDSFYLECKVKNISEEKIDVCIDKYSKPHSKDQYVAYLTERNRELAKLNKKIKERIEIKIIKQNNDSNCTINDHYYVTNWRKQGGPCIGGGYD